MACKTCTELRAAILHGKMAEAAGITVAALRAKMGWPGVDVEPEQVPAPVEEPAVE